MTQWDSEPVSFGFGPEEPWYRQRGPLTVAITAAVAAIFLIIVIVVWAGGRGNSDAATETTPPTTVVTGDTSDQTTIPDSTTTTLPTSTVPETTLGPGATSTTIDPAVSTTTIEVGELTVWDLLQTRSNLSRVAELLVIAELDDVLRGSDEFTFFAPTNEALADYEATTTGAAVIGDQGRLTTFLLRHLAFPRKLTTQEIYAEGFVLVSTGEFLSVDPVARTLEGVGFLLIDDVAGNGVLHVMEDTLAP
jgi:uncharacterized surface protein with fasciclin (FAS1) repeats